VISKIVLAALAIGLLSSVALAASDQITDEERESGVKKEEIVRYAFAGNKMTLVFLFAMNRDCSVMDGWAYEIIKQPEHGTAELTPHTDFPTFLKSSPLFKCNEQKVEGQMLTYKPSAGYKGPDSLTYLMIGPSGFAWERTYHFNVRSLPATTTRLKQRGA